MQPPRITRVAIALMSIGLLGACGPDTAPQAGPATRAETPSVLKSAARTMQGLSSYTFEGNVAAETLKFHIVGAFNAPNRLSETVTPEGGSATKIVVIGDRSFQLSPGSSKWTAGPNSGGGPATDPRAAFGALTNSEALSAAGERYGFRVTSKAASSFVLGSIDVRGAATVQGGRIVALSYASEKPAVAVDLIYAAFNAAPVVTPPT
jgi:hypothetical protein